MRILYINHYAGSPRHGMEFRPYYLSRELVRQGHSVMIAAGSFSHIRSRQPQLISDTLEEVVDGIRYRWFQTPKYVGNGIKRVLSMFSFTWKLWTTSNKLVEDFEPDVVIASSTYPMDIWPAHRIAKLSGAQLIFEVHDLWPLSPMELGSMSKWHPFILLVQSAEDYAYRHADRVISMLPKTLEYMKSRGMAESKFAYVPNGIDPEEWAHPEALPVDVDHLISLVRAKGRPVVGYAGTFGLANALDDLLDAAKQLLNSIQFVLIGTGPEFTHLLDRVNREQISNVTILPSIPKRAVPSFLRLMDIAYIGWHPNPLYRFGISPNKLMDYMMAGCPVVHSVSAGNDPVSEAGCGLTVAPNDPKAVAEALLKLAGMSTDDLRKMGCAGRAFVEENHTYPVLARKFSQCLMHSAGSA